jgi:hypothetical protein
MPKVDMNYSNTIIYKIVCKDINIKECYVGQTTNFSKRKYNHKSDCSNINSKHSNVYIYQFIKENGNWDNWDMIEIEKYNAVDKLDAAKRERYWIETLQATLNKIIPTRTEKEYKKEYRQENKDKIKEKAKEYRQENKDKIKEQHKEYYEQNKDKIKECKKEHIKCICGSVFRKDIIRRHERTKKHTEFLKTI